MITVLVFKEFYPKFSSITFFIDCDGLEPYFYPCLSPPGLLSQNTSAWAINDHLSTFLDSEKTKWISSHLVCRRHHVWKHIASYVISKVGRALGNATFQGGVCNVNSFKAVYDKNSRIDVCSQGTIVWTQSQHSYWWLVCQRMGLNVNRLVRGWSLVCRQFVCVFVLTFLEKESKSKHKMTISLG